jgi:hypothetical protein
MRTCLRICVCVHYAYVSFPPYTSSASRTNFTGTVTWFKQCMFARACILPTRVSKHLSLKSTQACLSAAHVNLACHHYQCACPSLQNFSCMVGNNLVPRLRAIIGPPDRFTVKNRHTSNHFMRYCIKKLTTCIWCEGCVHVSVCGHPLAS